MIQISLFNLNRKRLHALHNTLGVTERILRFPANKCNNCTMIQVKMLVSIRGILGIFVIN